MGETNTSKVVTLDNLSTFKTEMDKSVDAQGAAASPSDSNAENLNRRKNKHETGILSEP